MSKVEIIDAQHLTPKDRCFLFLSFLFYKLQFQRKQINMGGRHFELSLTLSGFLCALRRFWLFLMQFLLLLLFSVFSSAFRPCSLPPCLLHVVIPLLLGLFYYLVSPKFVHKQHLWVLAFGQIFAYSLQQPFCLFQYVIRSVYV